MTTKSAHVDFSAPCEAFFARKVGHKAAVSYRRFASVALAVRYAIEDQTSAALKATTVEVSETRLKGSDIRALYDSAEYPLKKRTIL